MLQPVTIHTKGNNPRKWLKHTKQLFGLTSGQDKALKAMAINESDGNIKLLAEKINKVYQSVTCGLAPLDKSKLLQPIEHTPSQYILSLGTVEKRIMKVKVFKAVGPDMIPNWVLLDLCSLISGPVCAVFNSSIREGYTPNLWKSADIVSLIKPTQTLKDISKDLRTIALTANLMKILESIIGEWLWDVIKPHIFMLTNMVPYNDPPLVMHLLTCFTIGT